MGQRTGVHSRTIGILQMFLVDEVSTSFLSPCGYHAVMRELFISSASGVAKKMYHNIIDVAYTLQ